MSENICPPGVICTRFYENRPSTRKGGPDRRQRKTGKNKKNRSEKAEIAIVQRKKISRQKIHIEKKSSCPEGSRSKKILGLFRVPVFGIFKIECYYLTIWAFVEEKNGGLLLKDHVGEIFTVEQTLWAPQLLLNQLFRKNRILP